MIVAGGYLEVNGTENIGEIAGELKRREIGINDIVEEKIMFLMERDNIDMIKSEIDSLRVIAEVKSVHLTYYSVESR